MLSILNRYGSYINNNVFDTFFRRNASKVNNACNVFQT